MNGSLSDRWASPFGGATGPATVPVLDASPTIRGGRYLDYRRAWRRPRTLTREERAEDYLGPDYPGASRTVRVLHGCGRWTVTVDRRDVGVFG